MEEVAPVSGFFSVLRWSADPMRDEARNVAVIVVDERGEVGGIRSAPISAISPRLHDQGIVDSVVAALEHRLTGDQKLTLGTLSELHRSMTHSLYLTEPRPTAVPDIDLALSGLYKSLVAPQTGRSSRLTKGRVLDQVVNRTRRRGYEVRRGHYVKDFLFDVVVERQGEPHQALEVLSFATEAKRWAPTEHDAGHFLFAIQRSGLAGIAVVQPPTETGGSFASGSYDRVLRWFRSESIPVVSPDGVVGALEEALFP